MPPDQRTKIHLTIQLFICCGISELVHLAVSVGALHDAFQMDDHALGKSGGRHGIFGHNVGRVAAFPERLAHGFLYAAGEGAPSPLMPQQLGDAEDRRRRVGDSGRR